MFLARCSGWTPVLCGSVEKAGLGVRALLLVSRKSAVLPVDLSGAALHREGVQFRQTLSRIS